MAIEHYLKAELYKLIQTDTRIIDFLEQGSLDGLWYWDLEQPENEWMSPQFWLTLGIDPDTKAHLADEWQDLIHKDDLALALKNFNKHCEDSTHPYDQYVRYMHKDGHWVWVRCRGLAIRDASGKPVRMLGAHTDVTDIISLKEKEIYIQKLQELNEDLTVFSYSVSHDLQAPLASLKGLFGVLKQDLQSNKPDDIEETINLIETKIHKMEGLLRSILTLTRVNSRGENPEHVNLATILEEVIEDFQLQFENENIACEFQLNNLDKGDIYADQRLLYRLFTNLLANSIKYRKPGQPLKLGVSYVAKRAAHVISLQDNGIGLKKELVNDMFKYFSRLHASKEYQGYGLGLAICRRIVEKYHGKIEASSDTDQGMTITITLPRRIRA